MNQNSHTFVNEDLTCSDCSTRGPSTMMLIYCSFPTPNIRICCKVRNRNSLELDAMESTFIRHFPTQFRSMPRNQFRSMPRNLVHIPPWFKEIFPLLQDGWWTGESDWSNPSEKLTFRNSTILISRSSGNVDGVGLLICLYQVRQEWQ